jgi:hypothetical protein
MTEDRDRRVNDSEIYRTLGRIETSLKNVEEKVDDTKLYARDISARVRSLEVSRGWFIGTGVGAGALGSWVLSLFR